MEKLNPEDISRAREWRDGVKIWPLTADEFDYYLAAYSAAENERLMQELDKTQTKLDTALVAQDKLFIDCEAAEAKRDRLKGALRDMVVIAQQDDWHNALTGRQIVLEAAEAALRPEGE